jgi:phage terminase large subunit-like protein
VFNEEKADRSVRFIERLKHTKGSYAGQNFLLEEWQSENIVKPIFGNVKENGDRIVRTAYIEVPRKNGKSELGAAIALYLLIADNEYGAEIYSAAADRDQAAIIFAVAAEMVRQDPFLRKELQIIDSTKRILYRKKNSVYRVLSADAHTKHGFNAHGIIFDELHTQPNRKLWDVLTTSGGTRRQPLVFAITTAGYDRNSICWEQHEYSERILNGIVDDPTFYPVIYAASKDDDWTDEAVWHKANPALGTFRDIDEMRSMFTKAKETPALQNTFRRLYLDQWTSQEDRWLDLHKWDESAGEVFEEDLLGETCYAGLDLASTTDIAAFVMVFPDNEGSFDVWPLFFIPEDNMRERSKRDRVPYDVWVREGYIYATPGNVIDYRFIRNKITEMGEKFYVKEVAFDRWGAEQLRLDLEDEGFDMIQFVQSMGTYNSPTNELMHLVLQKRLRHGGNPVLRWMADNLVVKQNPDGKLMPDKSKSTERIDGMVALIMGLDRAIRHTPSVYEERGIITI